MSGLAVGTVLLAAGGTPPVPQTAASLQVRAAPHASASRLSAAVAHRSATPLPSNPVAIGVPDVATHPCTRPALRLDPGQPDSEATGEHSITFSFTNVSRRACYIRAYPTVTLLDAAGEAMPFTYKQGRYLMSKEALRTVSLWPGGHASFDVAKYRCDVGIENSATSIVVRLGAGGRPFVRRLGDNLIDMSNCSGGAHSPGHIIDVSAVGPYVPVII